MGKMCHRKRGTCFSEKGGRISGQHGEKTGSTFGQGKQNSIFE